MIDREGAEALTAAIRRVCKSRDVRVIVLRGAGERALIGGADIRAMVDLTPEASRAFITSIHDLCTAIRYAPIPVVARMSGYCLGAGLEIAVSCDLRVADTTAKFGMPEVQVGLPSVIYHDVLVRQFTVASLPLRRRPKSPSIVVQSRTLIPITRQRQMLQRADQHRNPVPTHTPPPAGAICTCRRMSCSAERDFVAYLANSDECVRYPLINTPTHTTNCL